MYRTSRLQLFFKIGVLKNFAIFTRKHLCWSLYLKKAFNFIKETPTQVFSCENCKIFKNSFFIEYLRWLLQNYYNKNSLRFSLNIFTIISIPSHFFFISMFLYISILRGPWWYYVKIASNPSNFIVCTPPPPPFCLRGFSLLTNFRKGGEGLTGSPFWEGSCREKGGDIFQGDGGAVFSKQNVFICHN